MRNMLVLLVMLVMLVPSTTAIGPVTVVHGHGEADYTNFSLPWLDCRGFTFDIEMTIEGDTAYVTMQAFHPEWQCTTAAQYYSVNPVIVHGSWEEGWEGHAVGAEPPAQHWPVWEIVIDTNGYDGVYLWSWYVDETGRQHLFEGEFDILSVL